MRWRASRCSLVDRLDADAARTALSTGRVVLVAEPGPGGGVIYRYDDTNPEGRTARMIADRALQVASGRVDPVPVPGRRWRERWVRGTSTSSCPASWAWAS